VLERLLAPTELAEQPRQVRPDGGEAGESGHHSGELLLELAEPILFEADEEQLDGQEGWGVPLAGGLAQLESGEGSPLTLFEVPGENGADGQR
jgi:hypothetical protein